MIPGEVSEDDLYAEAQKIREEMSHREIVAQLKIFSEFDFEDKHKEPIVPKVANRVIRPTYSVNQDANSDTAFDTLFSD